MREIDQIYGFREQPLGTCAKIWPKGIPQYEMNYPQIADTIQSEMARTTNLHICANYYGGISFNDCIKNARQTVYDLSV